jgi:hypothetical protein
MIHIDSGRRMGVFFLLSGFGPYIVLARRITDMCQVWVFFSDLCVFSLQNGVVARVFPNSFTWSYLVAGLKKKCSNTKNIGIGHHAVLSL